jgi:hypothetical protein
MQIEILSKYISSENIKLLMEFIDEFGILAGISLPVIETFIPILPLVVFVSLNVFFFGFFLGLLTFLDRELFRFDIFIFIYKIYKNKKTFNKCSHRFQIPKNQG